jgi:flagellar protein FliJ
MRKFHFRLQSILDVRRYEEDQRRMELGDISSRCARLEREINRCRESRCAVLTARRSDVRAEDISYRISQAAYAARMDAEERSLRRQLQKAEVEREAAVERYHTARRAADVLDRLRQRRASTYRRDQNREEQKTMDDIAMSRRMFHGNALQ